MPVTLGRKGKENQSVAESLPWQQREFETSLGDIRPCLKKTKSVKAYYYEMSSLV